MKNCITLSTIQQLFIDTGARQIVKKAYAEVTSSMAYVREDTGRKSTFIPGGFTIISHGCMNELSRKARLFVIDKLAEALKTNNVLWYQQPSDYSYIRSIIAELKKKEFLYPTDCPGLYIVDPTKLRRGSVGSCLSSTLALVRQATAITPDLVRDLGTKDEEVVLIEELTSTMINNKNTSQT